MEKFFKIHGCLANIDIIYDRMLAQLFPDEREWESDEFGNYVTENGTTVPKMVDGKFTINGIEKVPFIQEVRNRECFFISKSENEVIGETKVSPECHPLRISVSTQGANIIVSSIRKDLENHDPVPVMSFLESYYNSMEIPKIKDIIKDVPSINTYIIAHETPKLYIDRDTIEDKYFGSRGSRRNALTLIYLFYKCFKVYFGKEEPTDRDNYIFKVLRSSGDIIGSGLRRALDKKSVNKAVDKEVYHMLRTGNVVIHGKTYSRMVGAVGTRSTIDAISTIRRVVVPCDENSMSMEPRQIHPSQRGYICPCETPEGKSVGLVKNLALTCILSTPIGEVEDLLKPYTEARAGTWMILNGKVLGFSDDPETFYKLKDLKKDLKYMSVFKHGNEIHVRTTTGRPMRPMVKRDGTWEYLDASEDKSEYDEIHPCTMFGISVSMIPFSEHNHGARNIFAASMVKQAMQVAIDKKPGKYLAYGQKPLVTTAPSKFLIDRPNGMNVLVCIMSYDGYNQEDAIIVKRSCIERGLFDSIVYENLMNEEVSDRDLILRSDDEIFVVGEKISSCEGGDLDTKDGRVRVSRSIHRKLKVGDKLASRHAQKGVVGIILNEEDMPFSTQGVTPDIIINPHSIPSRMTVGQLLEGVVGRRCCIEGKKDYDGTPFEEKNVHEIAESEKSEVFYSGATGRKMTCRVSMGVVYYMSLVHQVEDKIYIRWKGPRSNLSNQPVSGRKKHGGLRFGEMEYDGIIARGASSMVIDTIKNSDAEIVSYCSECGFFPKLELLCRRCGKETKTCSKSDVPHSLLVLSSLMASCNIGVKLDDF